MAVPYAFRPATGQALAALAQRYRSNCAMVNHCAASQRRFATFGRVIGRHGLRHPVVSGRNAAPRAPWAGPTQLEGGEALAFR